MYGTAEGFKAYHNARGRDVSAYDDDEIEAAGLVASEWIDARYRTSFPGLKTGMRLQMREWPRNSAVDIYGYVIASDVIPDEAINASYEAMLRQLVAPGSLSKDWTPPKYKRVSIDGAVSAEYALFNSAQDAQTRFQIIDEIIAPILTGCAGDASPLSGGVSRV